MACVTYLLAYIEGRDVSAHQNLMEAQSRNRCNDQEMRLKYAYALYTDGNTISSSSLFWLDFRLRACEELLDVFVQPFYVFFAISWAACPVAPYGRESKQSSNPRFHVCYFVF